MMCNNCGDTDSFIINNLCILCKLRKLDKDDNKKDDNNTALSKNNCHVSQYENIFNNWLKRKFNIDFFRDGKIQLCQCCKQYLHWKHEFNNIVLFIIYDYYNDKCKIINERVWLKYIVKRYKKKCIFIQFNPHEYMDIHNNQHMSIYIDHGQHVNRLNVLFYIIQYYIKYKSHIDKSVHMKLFYNGDFYFNNVSVLANYYINKKK